MKLSPWDIVKDQFSTLPQVAEADLTGKTVVVLGANVGLGFEAVKHFAAMKPGRIIMACRNQTKGEAALEKLKTETGYQNAELWLLDLADFASVRNFADKFERDGGRLDILVENAAITKFDYQATKDGWESLLQVNFLSTALVALLLVPRMLQTAREHATVPRIVTVTSELHHFAVIPKEVLEGGDVLATVGSAEYCTKEKMKSAYGVSKLFLIFFVRELNDRLGAAPLIVNTVNPGMCISELRRDFTFPLSWFIWVVERIMAFTTEQGSRQLVFGAVGTQPSADALRGAYINQSQVQEPSDAALNSKNQSRIWDELVDTLGKLDPRVFETVDKYLTPAA
ncbi:hypothetical protein C8R46DRAFT_955254 [Mycena filopes]|nr:hypothetical protein C8R46DRAFT_955254 [Mycena filopes]